MAVGSAADSGGGDTPPLAQLLDCTVTCDAGVSGGGGTGSSISTPYVASGPSGPWDCMAVTVSDSAGLAALPDLVASQLVLAGATVLVSVEAGAPVRVDPSTWSTIKARAALRLEVGVYEDCKRLIMRGNKDCIRIKSRIHLHCRSACRRPSSLLAAAAQRPW